MTSPSPISPDLRKGLLDKFGHLVRKSHRTSQGDSIDETVAQNLLSSVVHDLASQEMRIPEDIGLIVSGIQTEVNGRLINDKTYLVFTLFLQ